MSGMTLPEFLLARIAEDEAAAQAECAAKREVVAAYADHLQTYRNNPTRFGEGQRFGLMQAIGYLATAYAGHPDYREEWAP